MAGDVQGLLRGFVLFCRIAFQPPIAVHVKALREMFFGVNIAGNIEAVYI